MFDNKNIDKKKMRTIEILCNYINCLKIDCHKLRTNYRYDVEDFLDNFINNTKKEGI